MKKAEIEWYRYPEEKPKVVDEYLITVNCGFFNITTSAIWENGHFVDNEEEQNKIGSVIAWAEMPEPYQEVSNE